MANHAESSESILNTAAVDKQINPVLEDRFKKELTEVQSEIKYPGWHTLRGFAGGLVLFILLGLNAFICYQEWQQSKQINNLINQLAPITQVAPTAK